MIYLPIIFGLIAFIIFVAANIIEEQWRSPHYIFIVIRGKRYGTLDFWLVKLFWINALISIISCYTIYFVRLWS